MSGIDVSNGAYRACHRAWLSRASSLARNVALGTLIFVLAPAVAAEAKCDLPTANIAHGSTHIPDDAIVAIDPGGVRKALTNYGIVIGGLYFAEAFQNWGGIQDGGTYDGVLQLYMNADMHKFGLWNGLCFHADGFQIHGRSITGENVGGLMPISNLEAVPATRLFELWFEQHMFDHTVSVKVGQIAADAEFFVSEGGGYFINGAWGWAPIAAENNPSGGPAYPLAAPGVRVAVKPTERTSLLVGVFNGDPAPACNKAGGDPQRCNDHGLDFELNDPPLLMIEGAYRYELGGGQLPGTLKIGGWNHFGEFEDNRVDVDRNLIAITGKDGRPLENNQALYLILDQLLWRVPGGEEAQGVGFFTRIAGAPDSRNLVDFYFDVGFTFTGMVPGRPDDALAIGFAYTGISDNVTDFDVTTGEPGPREWESLIEIAYTFEVTNGWTLQPDFQYIWNPSGEPGLDNAAVIGARSTMAF